MGTSTSSLPKEHKRPRFSKQCIRSAILWVSLALVLATSVLFVFMEATPTSIDTFNQDIDASHHMTNPAPAPRILPDLHNERNPTTRAADFNTFPHPPPQTSCTYSRYAEIFPDRSHLTPHRKLLYVKTPKTGSSSITSLLWRYLARRGMTVLNPSTELVDSEQTIVKALQDQGLHSVDAIIHHIRYNETMVRPYLADVAPPFRITSVRETSSRLRSAYTYGLFRMHQMKSAKRSPNWFCADLLHDFHRWAQQCNFRAMMDYLAPRDWHHSDRENVETVFQHYDHVIVLEQMTKSLLTMVPKLGFGLSDLLILAEKSNAKNEVGLDESDLQIFTELLNQRVREDGRHTKDQILYDRAVNQIETEFAALPAAMRDSISAIETMSHEVSEKCGTLNKARSGLQALDCIDEWIQVHAFCRPLGDKAPS